MTVRRGCQGPHARDRDCWAGDCQAGQRAAALSHFFHDRDPGSESDSESDRDSLSVPAASRWGHQLGDDEPDANSRGGDSDSEVVGAELQ